jgi:superfamily II DNA or RNA helicase
MILLERQHDFSEYMSNLDSSRVIRQSEGVSKFISSGARGIFHYPPGFGKTLTAILSTIELFKTANNPKKVLILTPNMGVYDRWVKAIEELWVNKLTENITFSILTIGELNNRIETLSEYSMVIIDEYHKFISELRVNIVKIIFRKVNYILGLTATMPIGSRLLEEVPLKVIDFISEKEAINNNWISDFIEYNIKLEFSDEDKVKYEEFSTPISNILDTFSGTANILNGSSKDQKIFNNDMDVVFSSFYGKSYYHNRESVYIQADSIRSALSSRKGWHRDLLPTSDYNKMLIEHWSPSSIKESAKRFVRLVRNRNDLLINNKVKLQAILELYNSNIVPTIIFNESTDFADIIANSIGSDAIVYHSNIKSRPIIDLNTADYFRYKSGEKQGQPKLFGKTTLRKMAIEGMLSGKYKALVTAKALDEGVDIPLIERAITSGGTVNPLSYAQRSGRAKRIDFANPEKLTKIYNFYFDDFISLSGREVRSRDKQKLILRQKGSLNVIWIDSLEELL